MILEKEEILEIIPHKVPFRFIDKIHHLNDEFIECSYKFDSNLDFYKGHFPGNPITPGVILIEAAAQMSLVSHGLWHIAKKCETKDEIKEFVNLFSEIDSASFIKPVLPDETIFVTAKLLYFKKNKIKHDVIMKNINGEIVMTCIIGGFGVKK